MANKNIIFNLTLEQYEKKYRNRRQYLVKFTKKEVEDFDKKHNRNDKCLLATRKWASIGDMYFEIPRAPRYTWFRNLNAGVQGALCLIGAGAIASAVTVPIVLLKQNNGGVVIPEITDDAEIEFERKTDEGVVYKVSPKSSDKKISDIESVYIGNDKLIVDEEYTCEKKGPSVELMIKQIAFDKHKGGVKVNPIVVENDYALSLVSNPSNTGTTLTGAGNYKPNETVNISATSVNGYSFDGWYDGSTKLTDNLSYTYTTTKEDKTLMAKFNANVYNITYLDKGGNTFSGIHPSDHPTSHTYGTDTTLKGATKTGYAFKGWYTDSACTGTPITEIGGKDYLNNITLYADWDINSYTITATAKDGHGTITGAGSYNYNAECTLTATAEVGYTFEGWYEDNIKISGAAATYKFNVTSDRTLEARFTQDKYTVSITADPTAGGTCGVSKGSDLVYNEQITLTATPNTTDNYKFVGFFDGDTKLSDTSPFTYTVTGSKALKAKFALNAEAFETCDWSYISTECNKLEDANFTTAAITEFCSKFTVNGAAVSTLDGFVGAEREVTVNTKVHKVRVIGTKHDIDSNDKKLALTFEFKNLISDSDGNSLALQWFDAVSGNEPSKHYDNSSIRKALCGSGNFATDILYAQKGQTSWSNTYKNKTILSMLPNDLQTVLKTTKKSVGIGTDYTEINYTDKLFMLSVIEMGYVSDNDKGYGTTYSYYNGHTAQTDAIRIKKQVNNSEVHTGSSQITSGSGQACQARVYNWAGVNSKNDDTEGGSYWVRSPYPDNAESYIISNVGKATPIACNVNAHPVVPAFCI